MESEYDLGMLLSSHVNLSFWANALASKFDAILHQHFGHHSVLRIASHIAMHWNARLRWPAHSRCSQEDLTRERGEVDERLNKGGGVRQWGKVRRHFSVFVASQALNVLLGSRFPANFQRSTFDPISTRLRTPTTTMDTIP
jgi:hypothetical protein